MKSSKDDIIHVHAGGMVGGLSICGNQQGFLVDDADKANCKACIQRLVDYCKKNPGYRYEDEVKRAAANVKLPF